MNAPVYFLLHAVPVVCVLGLLFFSVGVWVGSVLWKKTAEEANGLRLEIRQFDRMSAELTSSKGDENA